MTKKRLIKKSKKQELSIIVQPQTQEVVGPLEKGKYSMIATPMQQQQILRIFQQTPPARIKTRPARGGGVWRYVDGWYVKKLLNYIFGFMWDFEVTEHGREGNTIWVLGKLTIKHPKTLKPMIVKTQFGGAEVKQLRAGGNLDFANDLKAATTDALKKCAAELGIANDVYAPNEAYEETPQNAVSQPIATQPAVVPPKPTTAEREVQIVLEQIGKIKSHGGMIMIKDKIEKATDFSKEAKAMLLEAIAKRLTEKK